MSGFEIAGIVLRAIPLIVSGLENYQNGVRLIQRWRKYDKELQSLIRNIETERVKLQNVCEKLLDGLVPPSQIDAMVEEPDGDLWKNEEIQKKIRVRLWRSWSVFEEKLKDIQAAIKDISERVGNGDDVGKSDISLVAKELKRAKFTLRQSTYEGLLNTVKDGISCLESLATMNIELEPKRRSRSRVRLLNILRSLSSSVYRAVCSSLTCACKHRISMRVSDYMVDITPSHDEEDIVQELQVYLALSSNESQIDNCPSTATDKQWEEFLIRANLPPRMSAQTHSLPPNVPKQVIISTKQKKTVKFSLTGFSSSPTMTMVQTETVVKDSATSMSIGPTGAAVKIINIKPDINICGELSKSWSATERSDCLGMISDLSHPGARSYSVYPSDLSLLNGNGWRMISLRDTLEPRSGHIPPTYKQRLQLAVFIARSVLQFYKTPWLPEMPSNRDIFFMQNGSFSYYDRPFLMAKCDKSEREPKTFSIIRNPTLLATGVLLIELLQGKTIESLRVPEEVLGDGLHPLSIYMTAKRLLGEVSQASSNYGSAVRRCIDGEFQGKDLDLENEDFRHYVYCGVVALLEEDLNNC
ncbi:hypothetical protein V8C35DRAFT_296600 [Trichoderma chlorosporum]